MLFSQPAARILGSVSLYHCLLLIIRSRLSAQWTPRTCVHQLLVTPSEDSQAVGALGVKNGISDVSCKLSLYVWRVSRGVLMGTTCILRVLETTINSLIKYLGRALKKTKNKAPRCLDPSDSHFWILQI